MLQQELDPGLSPLLVLFVDGGSDCWVVKGIVEAAIHVLFVYPLDTAICGCLPWAFGCVLLFIAIIDVPLIPVAEVLLTRIIELPLILITRVLLVPRAELLPIPVEETLLIPVPEVLLIPVKETPGLAVSASEALLIVATEAVELEVSGGKALLVIVAGTIVTIVGLPTMPVATSVTTEVIICA